MASPRVDFRRHIAVSATVVLMGIALSAAADSMLGGWITVGGVVALIFNLHRFGRTGPE